jgi:hypothetical protein
MVVRVPQRQASMAIFRRESLGFVIIEKEKRSRKLARQDSYDFILEFLS